MPLENANEGGLGLQGSCAPPIERARGQNRPVQKPFAGVRRAVRPPMVLVVMAATWATVFVHLTWQRHDRFATFGFDLGIYDQGVWLLSRFKDPFVTVRGLELFGHHMNVVLFLFVPFYWLGAGPHLLAAAQVLVQAAGVFAVYLLARDLLEDEWLAVALSSILLLHPTYQFLTWEYFHPDALAVTPVLFAYWAARRRRWGWFAVAAVVAMACKEDVALSMFMLGLLIAVTAHRRIGLLTAGISLVWFGLATRVLIPAFNGIGPFYDSFFGDFGNSPGQIAANVSAHPMHALRVAIRPDRIDYYRKMLSPVAFLPIAALPVLAIAAPMIAINVLSSFPYTHQVFWHYSALPLAAIVIATVEAIRLIGRQRWIRRCLVGIVVSSSLATTVMWGPSPVGRQFRKGVWPLHADARAAAKRHALSLVPKHATVTATYSFVPHLTHRERIYEFPNPWKEGNWGVRGENRHDPARVRWLVLDRTLINEGDLPVMSVLLDREFTIRWERDGVFVAERVRPPPQQVPDG
jgi:uncharacterized membrane protein